MRPWLCIWLMVLTLLAGGSAQAAYTVTLPKGAFLLDESLSFSLLNRAWNNAGTLGPLIAPIERFEPGGGKQGTLTPDVDVRFNVLINQLQYGILDNLSFGIGIPVVLATDIDVDFGWTPGDYQAQLGRPYSESDFWDWAQSMGQPKPGDWRGNQGVLSDMVLGLRYRYSDHFSWCLRHHLALSVMLMANIPTGRQADPEAVVAAGTTMWDLHSQGELGAHLAIEKFFPEALDNRLSVGVDLFYEALLKQEFDTPTGIQNPLLLSYAKYVGDTYTLDPGDFLGASLLLEFVPIRGPAWGTWLVGGDAGKASRLPPLLTAALEYRFTWLFQSNWESASPQFDWEREKLWRPGYKNTLTGRATLSLLRLGLPLQIYGTYRNQTWIPGKNTRAANVYSVGLQVLAQFW